jgi:hypothetical protein
VCLAANAPETYRDENIYGGHYPKDDTDSEGIGGYEGADLRHLLFAVLTPADGELFDLLEFDVGKLGELLIRAGAFGFFGFRIWGFFVTERNERVLREIADLYIADAGGVKNENPVLGFLGDCHVCVRACPGLEHGDSALGISAHFHFAGLGEGTCRKQREKQP